MSKYLPILIFFILVDVIFDNSIFESFGTQPSPYPILLTIGMLSLQILSAPIQASFSDLYCRKRSLIISLSVSVVVFIFLLFTLSKDVIPISYLIFILVIKSVLGNTLPLSWSAIADGQTKNLRFSLALGTGSYAIAYLLLGIFNSAATRDFLGESWLSVNNIVLMAFLIIATSICLTVFRDIRDRHAHHVHRENHAHGEDVNFFELVRCEFKDLLKDIKHPTTGLGMCAYFLWAVALYCPLLWLVDFKTHDFTIVVGMFGYLIGIGILGFSNKIKDRVIIRAAFLIVIVSFFILFILHRIIQENDMIFSAYLFFLTLSNAFLSPTILNLFSKERKTRHQGKGFGLIVSADSAAFLVSCIIIFFLHKRLDLIQMSFISFIVFLLSWIPYSKYEKSRKNCPRIASRYD